MALFRAVLQAAEADVVRKALTDDRIEGGPAYDLEFVAGRAVNTISKVASAINNANDRIVSLRGNARVEPVNNSPGQGVYHEKKAKASISSGAKTGRVAPNGGDAYALEAGRNEEVSGFGETQNISSKSMSTNSKVTKLEGNQFPGEKRPKKGNAEAKAGRHKQRNRKRKTASRCLGRRED